MKVILILFVFSIYTYADTIAKVWQITKENDIVSVEDEPVRYDTTLPVQQTDSPDPTGLLHDVSDQQDISALPLAKTIPAQQPTVTAPVAEKHVPSAQKNQDTMQSRVDALKKVIEAQTGSQKEQKSKPSDIAVSEKVVVPHKTVDTEPKKSNKVSEIVPSLFEAEHFFALPSQHRTYLIAAVVLSLLLLPLLFRRKRGSSQPADDIVTMTRSQMQTQLGLFARLQGEVHQQFLTRKQNIIFNNDFTQYQKAKALLDLEKEYTDLEYNYLPKLFCDDYEGYIEAEAVLLARSELREVIQDFIEATLPQRAFTKFQREQIFRQIRSGYRTAQYNWQMDDIAQSEQNRQDERAYLLQ